jgi:transposase
MTTTTTPLPTDSTNPATLHLAFELGARTWKLGFSPGLGQKARERDVKAGDTAAVLAEITLAKRRFGLPETAPVVSCHEAGPEGSWLHRCLVAQGVANLVVDSASIEVNRQRRRAKTDSLDVRALLTLLIRHQLGEARVWRVVHVPGVEDEDRRHWHREYAALTAERTRGRNRVRALLRTQGVELRAGSGWQTLAARLPQLTRWDGAPLPPYLRERLERELERLRLVEEQRQAIARAMANEPPAPATLRRGGTEMGRWATPDLHCA